MDKEKTVFQCGAENGISFGFFLSAIFFALVYGASSTLLSFFGIVLIFCIPVVLFRYMRRYYASHLSTSPFSTLWTLGSLTFLCGALICAVVSYIWLEYVLPGFIYEQAQNTLAAYESIPELKNHEFTRALRMAVEDKILPSPIEFVLQMLWFTFTSGVILSLIVAPFAKIGKPRTKNKQ